MYPSLATSVNWISAEDLWFIVGAGIIGSLLVFLAGVRVASPKPPPEPEEKPEDPGEWINAKVSRERRKAPRRTGNRVDVLIGPAIDNGEEPLGGWVIDRSTSGLGLWSPNPVEPGTVLRVLAEKAPPKTPWIEIKVRTCQKFEGGWQLGCSFLKTPAYSVMLLFG